ncbi:MAG: FAD binding domain-containing protein [Spirochaetaceae bacterium]|jgi:CO/xanthine dehydrogenase FAD-binding subunit|nr:FAD binding domain-containing protein [Spirochaetaceae bacterium]
MAETYNHIFSPQALQDLFTTWAYNKDAYIYSSGINCLRFDGGGKQRNGVISLEKIAELKRISRTERYLELGSTVRLNKILMLGHAVPELLRSLIVLSDTITIRNIETLYSAVNAGCDGQSPPSADSEARSPAPSPAGRPPAVFLAVRAAMIALGASYELRTAGSSRWISASRYANGRQDGISESQELFVRARVPLEKWDWTLCRHFPSYSTHKYEEGYTAFLARVQNDTLTELRVVLSSADLLRDINSERSITGKKLPLSEEDTEAYIQQWNETIDAAPFSSAFLKQRFLNFVSDSISHFT